MNYLDIIIVIPLLWGIYKGFKRGFIIEIASFIALGLGIWGGIKFSTIAAGYLTQLFNIPNNIIPLVSFAATFIIIVIAVFSLAKMLEQLIKIVALGIVNRISGAIFGVLKFGLIISVILNFINTISSEINFINSDIKTHSILYQPLSNFSSFIIPEFKKLNINKVVEKFSKRTE